MLLLDKYEDGIRLAIWHITESTNELVQLIPNGNELYLQAKNKFKSESRIKEWIAVRILLYSLTGKNEYIYYKSNGAPFLKDSKFQISISHTKGYASIALSEKYDVGIDIERISNKVERVKSKFTSDSETSNNILKLHLIWSAKESTYKLLQIEGLDFKQDLKTEKFGCRDRGEFNIYHDCKSYSISYMIHEEFVLTVAHK